jgi:hypothetical protein
VLGRTWVQLGCCRCLQMQKRPAAPKGGGANFAFVVHGENKEDRAAT